LTLWLLGYPEAAQAHIDHTLREAREIGLATSLMLALGITNYTHILRGDCVAARAFADERVALADEKGTLLGKAEQSFSKVACWR
jgi:hypothetical protein